MSLLTDQDRLDIWLACKSLGHRDFCQEYGAAIEAAVIAKLAAGVNVEPVGYLNFIDRFGMEPFTTSPANESSKAVYHIYEMQIAIAAARVQALEEAARVVDVSEGCEAHDIRGGQEGMEMLRELAESIRALIGERNEFHSNHKTD